MYTNHHGNIHLNLLLFFIFTGDFSGETKRSVDSMEFLPFDGPGETKKTAIAKIEDQETMLLTNFNWEREDQGQVSSRTNE